MFAASGAAGSREYTAAVRRLVASLRRNEALRADVLRRALSPAALVAAPPESLATDAQRAALRAAAAAATRRATAGSALEHALPTSEHACPACGCRDALFLRVGGARDIGKSETWGSKDAEAFSLRLTCTGCKARAACAAGCACGADAGLIWRVRNAARVDERAPVTHQ